MSTSKPVVPAYLTITGAGAAARVRTVSAARDKARQERLAECMVEITDAIEEACDAGQWRTKVACPSEHIQDAINQLRCASFEAGKSMAENAIEVSWELFNVEAGP